ncbi:ABC transporter ATP-binding protein [Psychromarinibacter halotolerans]|uniref:ABC transporter ATP-binding protein n=1 Tax=Psychromarinibacter halotolerans TaxID=1775175 RepID=A0ABV7GVM2_9RHOB|nr:ABC transporter ATP-binding protein [Psychromarinibacter halotolerans]MDF0595314.1 ABC transporter ATP-binding protein [Psychromarinibacter halotolerans]
MSLLEMRNVEVSYPGARGLPVRAVAGIDLTIQAGRVTALVGESGCGKSSLGKAAVGLLAPSAGSIRFEGEPVLPLDRGARPARLRALQMVFQDPYSSLNPRRRIGEQVADGVRAGTDRGGDVDRKVAEVLERVGLPAGIATRYPHEFSGGQRQRIAIARALAAKPRCIVADEPISALDASAQASVARLLADLVKDTGMGMLFISHDLSIVRRIADDIAVMYLGKLAEQGEPDDLWRAPRHPYTRGLVHAIPRADGAGRLPDDLPGDVANPASPPSGCRFHPRCPIAQDICTRTDPPVVTDPQGRRAACHFPLDAAAPADAGQV